VRDQQRGGAQIAVCSDERLQHTDTRGDVKRSRGFIAQQYFRALGDGARNGHTLLLAT
jgi:hypothetical protein